MQKSHILCSLVLGGFLLAVPMAEQQASANVVTIFADGAQRGTVAAAGAASLLGFFDAAVPIQLEDAVPSATSATGFKLANSSEATEAASLNIILDPNGTFTAGDVAKTNTGGVSALDFIIDTLYFSLKIGQWTAFFQNLTGGSVAVTYTQTGLGAGLSHFSEYGPPVIPIPPALILFGTALAGMGFLSRRKRKQTAMPA